MEAAVACVDKGFVSFVDTDRFEILANRLE
jgi:hypothetical protein